MQSAGESWKSSWRVSASGAFTNQIRGFEMSEEGLTYSNPRMNVVIEDWPSGSLRTKATFSIEQNKRGERAVRVTVNPKTGRLNAPKSMTYATKARFVDGSDGRLYIIELSQFKHISVMKGTFDYSQETIYERDPRYAAVLALFEGEINGAV
jgi:hypothetical protein